MSVWILTVFLGYNSHAIKLNHLKFTIQWVLVYLHSCATIMASYFSTFPFYLFFDYIELGLCNLWKTEAVCSTLHCCLLRCAWITLSSPFDYCIFFLWLPARFAKCFGCKFHKNQWDANKHLFCRCGGKWVLWI